MRNILNIILILIFILGCSQKRENKMLTIAIPYPLNEFSIDPAKIQIATEANILRAIYSPLFEFDSNGKLFSKLVKNYKIIDDKKII